MSRTHGELFGEIGEMVFAAHNGKEIDLAAAAEELATRYSDLRMPAEFIARAIARSASAVGISLALLQTAADQANAVDEDEDWESEPAGGKTGAGLARPPAFAGLASGGRIAILS